MAAKRSDTGRLGDILVAAGVLSEEDKRRVLTWQDAQRQWRRNVKFGEAVRQLGLAQAQEIDQALARQSPQSTPEADTTGWQHGIPLN